MKMLASAILHISPKEDKQFSEQWRTLKGLLNNNLDKTIPLLFIDLKLGFLFLFKPTVFLFTCIDPKPFELFQLCLQIDSPVSVSITE